MPCRRDRQSARAAADIEHGCAGSKSGKADDALPEFALSAAREQPREKVIPGSPSDHEPVGTRRTLFHDGGSPFSSHYETLPPCTTICPHASGRLPSLSY